MITLFEEYKPKPKIGDYVFVRDQFMKVRDDEIDFFEKNIGQIIDVDSCEPNCLKKLRNHYDFNRFPYLVKFENIPESILYYNDLFICNCRAFSENEIVEFFEDKETLKIKKDANKYNL